MSYPQLHTRIVMRASAVVGKIDGEHSLFCSLSTGKEPRLRVVSMPLTGIKKSMIMFNARLYP